MSSETLICTKESIDLSHNACQYVRDACEAHWNYFNFYELYYCDINQNIIITVLLSLLFLALIFSFVAKIADSYLAPSLQTISQKLKLSEPVAGATLLALGNSAPEVVAGIVAGGQENGSMEIATGGLFGGAFFTITVILAGCILGARTINLDKGSFIRDLWFLAITIGYFIVLTIINTVTPLLASGFFVLYLIYIGFVIFQEKRKIRKQVTNPMQTEVVERLDKPFMFHKDDFECGTPIEQLISPARKIMNSPLRNILNLDLTPQKPKHHSPVKDLEIFETVEKNDRQYPGKINRPSRFQTKAPLTVDTGARKFLTMQHINSPLLKSDHAGDLRKSLFKAREEHHKEEYCSSPAVIKIKLKEELSKGKQIIPRKKHVDEVDDETLTAFRVKSFLEEEEEAAQRPKSALSWVWKILNLPMHIICNLTILPFEEDTWNVYQAAATPFFGSLFLAWQFKVLHLFRESIYVWIGWALTCFAVSALIYWAGRRENLAEKYEGTFATLAFLSSILWLNLITNLIIEFLALFEVMSGLPLSFISLTILAWGTAIEDLFINIVISKSGLGQMAVVGIFSSQIFAVCVGFGLAVFRQAMMKTVEFNMYDFTKGDPKANILSIVLISTMLVTLVATWIFARSHKYVLNKSSAIFVGGLYLVMLVVFTLISFIF